MKQLLATVTGLIEASCKMDTVKVEVVEGDITKEETDAIVSSTNENLTLSG